MELQLLRTDLFGGAMRFEIPTGFLNASKARPVPDHQEVFTDRNSDVSIILELNERVDEPNIEGALKYHLEDVVDSSDRIRVWQSSVATFSKLPSDIMSSTLMATIHPSVHSPTPAPKFTAILMILARLKSTTTDILVSINIPHKEGTYDPAEIQLEDGSPGARIAYGLAIRNAILHSFEIQDWDIMVN